jgi:hypothetical protein
VALATVLAAKRARSPIPLQFYGLAVLLHPPVYLAVLRHPQDYLAVRLHPQVYLAVRLHPQEGLAVRLHPQEGLAVLRNITRDTGEAILDLPLVVDGLAARSTREKPKGATPMAIPNTTPIPIYCGDLGLLGVVAVALATVLAAKRARSPIPLQ